MLPAIPPMAACARESLRRLTCAGNRLASPLSECASAVEASAAGSSASPPQVTASRAAATGILSVTVRQVAAPMSAATGKSRFRPRAPSTEASPTPIRPPTEADTSTPPPKASWTPNAISSQRHAAMPPASGPMKPLTASCNHPDPLPSTLEVLYRASAAVSRPNDAPSVRRRARGHPPLRRANRRVYSPESRSAALVRIQLSSVTVAASSRYSGSCPALGVRLPGKVNSGSNPVIRPDTAEAHTEARTQGISTSNSNSKRRYSTSAISTAAASGA